MLGVPGAAQTDAASRPTQKMENHLTAMMILEYANDQLAHEEFETGITISDLILLAHHVLQNGIDKLNNEQKTQLAHLQGTLKNH